MNHLFRLLLLLFVTSIFAGCATLNEEDCQLGDWYSIGLQDGQNGQKNRASTYSKECSEYNVQVDLNEYKKGRSEGLKSYCTYENGVSVGEQNLSYGRVCPAGLASEFLSGYQPHRNLAKAKENLREATLHLDGLQESLEDESLKEDQIKKIKARIKTAKSSIKRAEGEVNRYEYDLVMHKIDREIKILNNELATSNVTEARRADIRERLDKLAEKRRYFETMRDTDRTIRSLKDIADLF